MKRGAALAAGKKVGIFAPGSPASPQRFEKGCAALRKLGFEIKVPLDPSAYYGKYDFGFASESVQARVAALHDLLADDEVAVIIAARGAYGTLELLPFIDFDLVGRSLKPIVGYSDVSTLLLPVYEAANAPAIHGPTVSKEFAEYFENDDSKQSVDRLMAMLCDPGFRFEQNAKELRRGTSAGKVVASNLTALTTLLGTPWEASLDDSILFVEDIGEAPFRIQRCFEQLRLAGKLKKLQGLVLGRFDRCEAKHGPSVEDVFSWLVNEILRETDFPVITGFPFGHNGLNIPLPLGAEAQIDSGTVRLLSSPVA